MALPLEVISGPFAEVAVVRFVHDLIQSAPSFVNVL